MIRDINTFRQEYKHAQGWWEVMGFPAQALAVGANAPSWDTTNLGYEFNDNPAVSNEEVQAIAHMPHTWVEGSTIGIHTRWILLEDDGAANEDVKWDILYRWYDTGETSNGAWTTAETTVDVSGKTQWISLITELASVSGSGSSISSLLELRLQRDTNDAADDHPHSVLLKELDVHYQIDQPGSLFEYGKWDDVTI